MKDIRFFYLKFSFFGGKIFIIFELACFRNVLDFISIIKVTDLINTINLVAGISLHTDKYKYYFEYYQIIQISRH